MSQATNNLSFRMFKDELKGKKKYNVEVVRIYKNRYNHNESINFNIEKYFHLINGRKLNGFEDKLK